MTRHPYAPALDRRQRRRRLLLWSALPVLLVLCLAAKLLSVGVLAGFADRSFAGGNAAAVADAATGLRIANLIEPHKAPFAEGDALFLAGHFAGARDRFEEALSLAGTADECVIRANLALTVERLGDARLRAEDPTAAGRLFAEGLAVVHEAPEGCFGAGTGADGRRRPRVPAALLAVEPLPRAAATSSEPVGGPSPPTGRARAVSPSRAGPAPRCRL